MGVFSHGLASGSHYQSIDMIRRQQADIAAIDCVSFALLQRADPSMVAGLKIIAQTEAALVATDYLIIDIQRTTSPIRQAITDTVNAPEAATAKDKLLIRAFNVLPWSAYNVIKQMQATAFAAGIITL